MEKIIDDLKIELSKYLNSEEKLSKINEAIEISKEEYKNSTLLGKLNLFEYAINTAYLLATYQSEPSSIISAILFKIDDKKDDLVKEKFGVEVYNMIIALRKIDHVKKLTNYEIDNENFRKIFVALANDYKVIVLRLAMQEVLLKNASVFDEEYQKFIAQETLEVYSPLAHRLGMFKLKSNLENTALYNLEKEQYLYIQASLKQREDERMNAIEKMKKEISTLLENHKINYYSIKGRPKQIFSIYNKMKKKNLNFNQLYDLLALRIITMSEVNCYEILGYIHTVFKPIPGKFKDYIAMPKPNMYQSLHTSVIGLDGNIYEIQIRTKEMDEVAESGVAAHWKYKEGSNKNYSQQLIEEQLHWFKDYVSISETSDEHYVENLKNDIFGTNIYVMSPKGKVVDLPRGSTPVDFAYRIHSNVGHACVGALVNGVMVSLSTTLKTGDVVEIRTSKIHVFPSEGWLQFVKTNYAKNNIRKALLKKNKEELRDEFIRTGNELISEEIKNKNLEEKKVMQIINSAEFLKSLVYNSVEDLYVSIANRNISASNVLDKVKAKLSYDQKPTNFEFRTRTVNFTSKNGVVVNGIDNIKVTLSQCCSPIPGDKIVGFISRGNGIRVHRYDCPTLDYENARLIDVDWDEEIASTMAYQVELLIRASDRTNLLIEIVNTFSTLKVSVNELKVSLNKQNFTASFNTKIMVNNKDTLDSIIVAIKNIHNVISVERLTKN